MFQRIAAFTSKVHPILWQFLSLTIAMLVFVFILTNRSPFLIRPVSMSLRTGFGIIIPAAALVLYAVFRIPGRLGPLFSLTTVLALFALGLAGLWALGNTQPIMLSGLIPISDATNYYMDASRILHGLEISNFSGMRPFFPGLLSFFLWVTDRNLMAAVGIFTAIAGFSAYLAGMEIRRSHGAEAAVFFVMLMFLYYRHHSGTTMSESLGAAVSLLGTALLWQGISARREWVALFGITMIALALNIRPGAMFVLPALLVWGGWVFRGQRKFSIKFFALGIVLVALTFYANKLMIDVLSGSKGVPFENFAWAFYGLASGGNSWTYVFQAHPELSLLDSSEVTPAIYKLAFELILAEPSLLVKGALFYWRMFFSNTWYNAYSFVAGENYWVNETARWGMYLLGGFGIFKWLRDRQDPFASLSLIAALGVLVSVPFVPPTDAYRVRLYAATIPFFALLPTIGLSFLVSKINSRLFRTNSFQHAPAGQWASVLSLALIAVMLVSPVLLKSAGSLPPPPESNCPQGADGIFIRFDQGTFVNVLRENVQFLDWMPNFHSSTFRRNAHSLVDINLVATLESANLPATYFYALDFQSNREALVIIESGLLPEPGTLLHLCGFWDDNPDISAYRVFHASQLADEQP